MANPCWEEVKKVSADILSYIEAKTGVKYDPNPETNPTGKGKDEYLAALKELKQESVNDLKSIHDQVSGKAVKTESPTPKPPEPPKEEVNQNEGIGITHADTKELRAEYGLPEYGKTPETVEQWKQDADKRIANGEVPALIKKMERGDSISDVEQIMMGKHIATLDSEVSKNPSNINLKALKDAVDLSDKVGGTEWGKSGRARQETFLPDDSLGTALIKEMESLGVDELPEKTKEQIIKEHHELANVKEDLAKANEEIIRLQVEAKATEEFNKTNKTVNRKANGNRDFKSEKQSLKDKLKQQIADYKAAGQKLGITADGGAESFVISAQMAKTIGQYIKVNIEEGVKKFEDLINSVYEDIKDLGVTKRHILDVMAGVYNEKQPPTRNEMAAKLKDFKTEAVLLKKLEDARLGKEPKTSKEHAQKSRRIIDLENKIKEIRERNKDTSPVEKTEGERLAAKRKFIQKSIDEIENDIKAGRFEKPEKLPPVRLDKKTQALEDRLIQLETQQMIRRQKNEYEKSSRFSKAADTFWQVLGLRRFVNAAIDFSILFRQAAPITMNIAKYIPRLDNGKLVMNTAPRAIAKMFNVSFDPKGFARFQYNIEKSEDGRLFTHFNGVFSNPTEIKMDKREEEFTNNLLARLHQKIEASSNETLKKTADVLNRAWFSERAAAGLLNSIRIQEFSKGEIQLRKKGITPENAPEQYKELVKWVMNSTGRGNLLAALEGSHAGRIVANRTYFGARLMAAKINMLNPVYYAKMPKAVRVLALKDMAGYTTTLLLAGLALQAAGGNISLNPDKPDFLQARFGDKIFDFSGGSAGYVRTFLRFSKAVGKQITNLGSKDANAYTDFASRSIWKSMVANKLSPNTAYAYHFYTGKSAQYDANGRLKPFDPLEVAKIYPLYVDGTIQAYKEGGVADAMTILIPDLLGIGTQQYDERSGSGGGGGATGGFHRIKQPKQISQPKQR